jgi:hypothetical protein
MVICSECGKEYPDELEGCPACEGEGESVRCRRCGEEFKAADACPACGLAIGSLTCDRHPDATAEGRCVICGRASCAECGGSDRRVHLCAEHAGIPVIQGWAQIYSNTSEFEAQLLRENLTAEGIEARIFSQKDAMFSVDLGELSIVRILVPAWEYDRAERVIRDHMDAEGEVAFACPSCGEVYEAGQDACSSCGASLITGRSV